MSYILKPCPRCGDEMHIIREWIECEGCYLTYGYNPSRKKIYDDIGNLIKQWNIEFPPKLLTLKQLSKMTDVDWIWLDFPELPPEEGGWHRAKRTYMVYSHKDYGKTWLAYNSGPIRRGE